MKPDLTVIVATIRALKMHGGVAKDELKSENVAALEKGFANLKRHIANVSKFGVPVLVTVNKFSTHTRAEMDLLGKLCETEGVDCVVADNWGSGGAGAADLARAVVRTIEARPSTFKPLYADDLPLVEKVRGSPRSFTAPPTSPSTRA